MRAWLSAMVVATLALGARMAAAQSAEDAGRRAGREAGQAVERSGDAIEQGAEETGEAIEESGDAAERNAERAGEKVKEGAEETGEKVKEGAEETGEKVEEGSANIIERAGEKIEDVASDVTTFLGQRGVSVSAGLGLNGYINNEANDFIDPGAVYTARVHVGTEQSLGFEVAYVGSANNIEALGLDGDAVLASNALEAAVRYNFTTRSLQPYLLAGAAWRRYNLLNDDRNTSSVNGGDSVLEVPLAAGLTWRPREQGLFVDGRFDYRLSTQDDLLGGASGGGPGLDNWDFSLKAGWQF